MLWINTCFRVGRPWENSKFAGDLPMTFISFLNWERGTQSHKKERTEIDLCDQDVSPNVCPERVEVPETDTTTAKSLTILQRLRTGEQTVSSGTVGVHQQSNRRDDEVNWGEHCTEKLRSLGGGEFAQILGEDSAAELSGGRESREQVVTEGTAAEKIVLVSRVIPVMSSLTSLKSMEEGRYGSLLLGVTPFGTPVKRVSNVMFANGEPATDPAGSARPA